jgi:hypothetical protein
MHGFLVRISSPALIKKVLTLKNEAGSSSLDIIEVAKYQIPYIVEKHIFHLGLARCPCIACHIPCSMQTKFIYV